MKREYDSIISLGGFCGAALQLRARGLRPCSFPFDWLFMDGSESIQWLLKAFDDDFATFAKRENLVPMQREGVGGLAPYKYLDTASGYGFVHHFWKPLDEAHGEFRATMDRRIKRMLSCFASGRRVLLILATPFPFDRGLADDLVAKVRGKYPDTSVDFHVMQFGFVFDDPLVEAERWPSDALYTGGRYARKHGEYDLSRTSAEWSFLDEVTLRGRSVRKPQGLGKLAFKLWKSLSKRLCNAGYGCLGIRFVDLK